MTTHIKEYASFLKFITNTENKRQRQFLLQTITQGQSKAFCEVILNILNGNICITPVIKEELSKYKRHLRYLADPSVKLSQKHKYIRKKYSYLSKILITFKDLLNKYL